MDRRPGHFRPRGHPYEPNLRGCGPGRPVRSLTVGFIGICYVLPALVLAQIIDADGPTSTLGEDSSSYDLGTALNVIHKDTAATETSPFTENLQSGAIAGNNFGIKQTEATLYEDTGTTPILSEEITEPTATTQYISGLTTQHVTASPTLKEELTPRPRNSGFDSFASTTPSLKSSTILGDTVHLNRVLTATSESGPALFRASEVGLNETLSEKERALRDYGSYGKSEQRSAEMKSHSKYPEDQSFVVQEVSMVPAIPEASTQSKVWDSTHVNSMLRSTPFISSTQATLTQSFGSKIKVVKNTSSWNENHGRSHSADHIALVDADGTSSTNSSSMGWPTKMAAVVEGDLVLGGLMMVHEREDTITCGPIMPQGGVQALEAMLYTLDVINAKNMLPGITLGAHILDDCDKDTYGLEMAVDFIKGSMSNIDDTEYHCNKTAVRKVISGVVGAASSVTSIQVANLLRLFRIPQVSFFSTSPELSNKQRFEFFSRTIPSDHYQVKAMVEIIKKMQWSYVSIIYEESNYGIKAFEELEDLLKHYNVCIAVKEKLVKDSGVANEGAYEEIVQKLLTKPRAKGAIIFGSDQEVAGVMRAVRRLNATKSFSWIGSDGWSARALVSDGNELEVEGTLSVQPQAHPVRGFSDYFLNLTVENNRRNPWFVEFWEAHFQCKYPNSSKTPYNLKFTNICSPDLRLTKENTVFEDQLQFVSDAVMAFAHALKAMHQQECKGHPGLCDAMKPIEGSQLLKHLRKVDFEGLSGDRFTFDAQGDGPARYNIIHFKQEKEGQFQWLRVGEYSNGTLNLDMSAIQFKFNQPQLPESVCSLPCELGQAKKLVEGDLCCWHCFNCTQYQIRHPTDVTRCFNCPLGTVPDANRINCREIPEVFLRFDSGWAIGAMSFSSLGVLVTLFVAGVFYRHHDTPVVRASGRELSYMLLTGILLCFCVTFALVMRPTNVVCGIQWFSAGLCFTIVYAALFTKTNCIARVFKASKKTAKRPSFTSPSSQIVICVVLITIQIFINVLWMVISPPLARHHHPTREDNHLVCQSHIDASYMIAFGYPIVLIVVCTVYAVLTRKIPEAFNESKHIGFTMYTTCVIWLAFVPLYFGTGSHVPLRITSMSVTISLSASVTLACLFSPKLYIILIHPERNVRQPITPAMRFSTVKNSATGNSLHPAAAAGSGHRSILAPITAVERSEQGTQSNGLELTPAVEVSTQTVEIAEESNPDPTTPTRNCISPTPTPSRSSLELPFSRTRSYNSALRRNPRRTDMVNCLKGRDSYLNGEPPSRKLPYFSSISLSCLSSNSVLAPSLEEQQGGSKGTSLEAVVGSPTTPSSVMSADTEVGIELDPEVERDPESDADSDRNHKPSLRDTPSDSDVYVRRQCVQLNMNKVRKNSIQMDCNHKEEDHEIHKQLVQSASGVPL